MKVNRIGIIKPIIDPNNEGLVGISDYFDVDKIDSYQELNGTLIEKEWKKVGKGTDGKMETRFRQSETASMWTNDSSILVIHKGSNGFILTFGNIELFCQFDKSLGSKNEIERMKNLDSDKSGTMNHTEVIMGDKYDIKGQTGAVGAEAHAHDMTFNQNWNENNNEINLPALAAELSKLRLKLRDEATEAEHYSSMGAIASAESCAKKGDRPRALEYLSKAGKWALDIAEKISVPVATEALKVAVSGYTGIPKV